MFFEKSFVLAAVILVFSACYQSDPNPALSSHTSASTSQNDVNHWTTQPPNPICGTSGYQFLMSQYIGPNCASCHNATGFAPGHFADATNIAQSISQALAIGSSTFLPKCTSNDFCGPGCNLDPSGEVYKGIAQWFTCPQ